MQLYRGSNPILQLLVFKNHNDILFLFLGPLLTPTMINILYAKLEIAISDCVLFFVVLVLVAESNNIDFDWILVDEIKK